MYNKAYKMIPLHNLQFLWKRLHRMGLLLCVMRHTPHFFRRRTSKNILILYSDKQDVLNTCATHIQSSLKLQLPCKEGGNIFKLVLKILHVLTLYRRIQIALCRPEREICRRVTVWVWVPEKWTEVIGLTHFNKPSGNFFVVHSMDKNYLNLFFNGCTVIFTNFT